MATGDVKPYLDLVIGEHSQRPKLIASLTAVLQPICDTAQTLVEMPSAFDLDTAVGVQLDAVGLWIGRTRFLSVPLPNVYFSWDEPDVGWELGVWYQNFNPTTGLVALPDDGYRTLLKATIIANHWDGTVPGAYAAWDALFAAQGITIFIQDESSGPASDAFSWDELGLGWEQANWRYVSASGNMHIIYGLLSANPVDAITLALFTGGYMDLKPIGVKIDDYVIQSVPGAPIFGWDVENPTISGWEVGGWGLLYPGV